MRKSSANAAAVCLPVWKSRKASTPMRWSSCRLNSSWRTSSSEIEGPLDLGFLRSFTSSLKGFSYLLNPPVEPMYPAEFDENEDFFEVLSQRDVLVYHPYESFDAMTDFIIQASEDEQVMAIKMTLYRVSGNSPLITALANAAESGKRVTVVVELKARFDEERNIAWARKLEQSGCHVVYGLVGLKTHAKVTLIVRQEGSELRRYVHVGTGNYNDSTAKAYTDLSLFTANHEIGLDASELFNQMTGYSANYNWNSFIVAPTNMSLSLQKLILREAEHAAAGRPARIIAKMNSLSNQEVIDYLYSAAQAGVSIDLIVRESAVCVRELKASVSALRSAALWTASWSIHASITSRTAAIPRSTCPVPTG